MTQILSETYLDYSDILIKPKLGNNLNSRKDVNLTREYHFKHGQTRTGLGVFNANMATVGNFAVAKKLLSKGMFATLHKHYTVDEINNFVENCLDEHISVDNLFVSIGVKNPENEIEKLKHLFQLSLKSKWKCHYFPTNICIDAPNFYIDKAYETLKSCRKQFPQSVIMCGNIASSDICHKLLEYADIIKIGIGPGSVCRTRSQTGCGVPMVSCILDCADVAHSVKGMICADGGIVEVGDICKAFALNSDFVMIGGMFAGTNEAEGEVIEKTDDSNKINKFKLYYGMSSTLANNKFAGGMSNYKASEGREVLIPYTGSIDTILQDIRGGIASACTYIGSANLKDISKCSTLIKVNHTINRIFEKYEKGR